MIKKVKTEDLRKGMHIVLPDKWFAHPFLKNEFIIESQSQIDKIARAGIREVAVRVKGTASEPRRAALQEAAPAPEQAPVCPPELQEVIADRKLPPEKKAKLVRQKSIEMMSRLMEDPSAENIAETKKGVADVVDLILTNDSTSKYLLNITSYDYSTYVHSVNVGFLAVSCAKSLFRHSTGHNMHELGAGFFLHDLGKVNIDLSIINKPARLSDEEMAQMRKHPQYGYEILARTRQLTEECRTIVLHHHERFDGSGYPLGLKGEDIHLYGRICSLADVFDALNSDRPYRKGLGPFAALKVMKEEMMFHFQKDMFEKFVMLFS
ncbi:MAG: HD-GYP domain-containing protein [Deltaproteobacteria bacterium]|jgi:HD-GYP domain-containing protein (c-di-GMP phosphodiesterase class II)|nr:HD-GYP domain-containing protein [Syntrophaceae bacterium]